LKTDLTIVEQRGRVFVTDAATKLSAELPEQVTGFLKDSHSVRRFLSLELYVLSFAGRNSDFEV
jgi:hypothetical protein